VIFQSPESQFKNLKIPINSGLRQAGIACPRKMTLGSWFLSNSLFRFSKLTFWRHQIMEDDLPGLGQFRLVAQNGLMLFFLNFTQKLAGPPLDKMSLGTPQKFEWPDNTF
jgi:hypothetical protein